MANIDPNPTLEHAGLYQRERLLGLAPAEPAAPQPIQRTFDVESRTLDEKAGVYEAMITTQAPDRANDEIIASGGRFESYLRNPVVLWAHRYAEPPVARCLSLTPVTRGITARFQFPPAGASARADEIHGLWQARFLNAVSIGILPLKTEPISDAWGSPRRFLEWEMLEFSLVPIPMNPEAVRLAVQRMKAESGRMNTLPIEEDYIELISRYLATLKTFLTA